MDVDGGGGGEPPPRWNPYEIVGLLVVPSTVRSVVVNNRPEAECCLSNSLSSAKRHQTVGWPCGLHTELTALSLCSDGETATW